MGKKKRAPTRRQSPRPFGGRGTAGGVAYEVQIAACLAIKMLYGDRAIAWEGVRGSHLAALTLQGPDAVDDVIVEVNGLASLTAVHISAKDRSGPIALTAGNPAFAETVTAFVRQFRNVASSARASLRLVWAVPSSAGSKATRDLLSVLDSFRLNDGPMDKFILGRSPPARAAFRALQLAVRKAWRKQAGKLPTEAELRPLLRAIHVQVFDFGSGAEHDRQAQQEISSHLAATPADTPAIWQALLHHFMQADQRGIRTTGASLRRLLLGQGQKLQSPPDYAADITALRTATTLNRVRLAEHASLRFGTQPTDVVHLDRSPELHALMVAARGGHLLVTGEPGAGKSGLLHDLAETLEQSGIPTVVLLAEEVFGPSPAGLHGLKHPLDEVLGQWPESTPGVLVTDALDAVRDLSVQQRLRDLIRAVKSGTSGWTVVASVREFDLRFGRELRDAFPGAGVPGYEEKGFAGVAHFHVPRLSDTQLNNLAQRRPEIGPFLEKARTNRRSDGLHRSPFYLRLAAALLKDGVNPQHLGDWNSPALLMRKFWNDRINDGAGAEERRAVLAAICRRMVEQRRMAVSETELALAPNALAAIRELQRRSILQSPTLAHGMPANSDAIRFNHHLLHDYAIARTLIPVTADAYVDFTLQDPLLSVFYRQSFLFAVEELWDCDPGHAAFWAAALRLEAELKLRGITRILAPVLAARRVMQPTDLDPLFDAVGQAGGPDHPAYKALTHVASGLQDADPELIRAGSEAWGNFASRLAGRLPAAPLLETPLVHLLARLKAAGGGTEESRRMLNLAARALLTHYVGRPVGQGWRYAVNVAVEVITGTFATAPAESEAALLTLLAPERLAKFPHDDLWELARNLKPLGSGGDEVVRRVFEAAFAAEPERDQWEERGTLILGLRMQTSDQWNGIHYQLAEYYEQRAGDTPALLTEAACRAWNAVVRRRAGRGQVLTTLTFRGQSMELGHDLTHGWLRFEPEEARILTRFEALLREWAAAPDPAPLGQALDRFAAVNRSSLLWQALLEAGADFPLTLGQQLSGLLDEPAFLTESDYSHGATRLFGALHKTGDNPSRERLEKLALNLPQVVRLDRGEKREPPPDWVRLAQNRLLGSLEEGLIALPEAKSLWQARQSAKALAGNPRPSFPEVGSRSFSEQEAAAMRGINVQQPVDAELFRLTQELKALGEKNGKLDTDAIAQQWPLLVESDQAATRHRQTAPKAATELWKALVELSQQVAGHATWPKRTLRWAFVRSVLLRASTDSEPTIRDKGDVKPGKLFTYSMEPRMHAAIGLPWIACRLGQADRRVATALRRLARDPNQAVRLNLVRQIGTLGKIAPTLMWDLFDRLSRLERRSVVLTETAVALGNWWAWYPAKVLAGLRAIEKKLGPVDPQDPLHQALAAVHLDNHLRHGNSASEAYLKNLIRHCETPAAAASLCPLQHTCRAGGWLTAGDAVTINPKFERYRQRTWRFFTQMLATGQAKLTAQRAELDRLHRAGRIEGPKAKAVREDLRRTMELVDGIGMQLFFASGAHADRANKGTDHLSPPQLDRFWRESVDLLRRLALEPHPHTAYQLIETLQHLLPCAPREVFLIAAQSIRSSVEARFQYDHLAAKEVVKLVQQALADHRDIFRATGTRSSECLTALLEVLDFFVEAGWADARMLVNRLEEIYR